MRQLARLTGISFGVSEWYKSAVRIENDQWNRPRDQWNRPRDHCGQQPVHRSVKQIDRHLFLLNVKFKHTKILISNGFCK